MLGYNQQNFYARNFVAIAILFFNYNLQIVRIIAYDITNFSSFTLMKRKNKICHLQFVQKVGTTYCTKS